MYVGDFSYELWIFVYIARATSLFSCPSFGYRIYNQFFYD